jgi:hypothetical protein
MTAGIGSGSRWGAVLSVSDAELLDLRAFVERELRKRNLSLTVGEVGERLAVAHFCNTPGLPNLQPAPRGTKNVDALSRSGDRYSIKSICSARKTGTIYPDAQVPDQQLFEYLLVVQVRPDWTLEAIHRLSWAVFLDMRSWDKRMNAWYVAVTRRTLAASEVMYQVEDQGG